MPYPYYDCPECDGEGGWDVRTRWIECPACEGKGEVEIALAEIDEEEML